jgi:hypothetical protein
MEVRTLNSFWARLQVSSRDNNTPDYLLWLSSTGADTLDLALWLESKPISKLWPVAPSS